MNLVNVLVYFFSLPPPRTFYIVDILLNVTGFNYACKSEMQTFSVKGKIANIFGFKSMQLIDSAVVVCKQPSMIHKQVGIDVFQ